MTTLPATRQLSSIQAQARRDITAILTTAARQCGGIVLRYGTGEGGTIPKAATVNVRREVAAVLNDVFTAPTPGSPYADGRAPFAADGVTAIAPYSAALNVALARATVGPVLAHARYMADRLPPLVAAWLRKARVAELGGGFMPQVFARYEAPHTWVDPNGYRLSDRIWRTDFVTRQRIDRMLIEAIDTGWSATRLQRELEQFLIPGRAALRTTRPYGRDASFDAMRLARTEISRAYSQATFAASAMNPYVTGMDWALSRSHPRFDICDRLATIGMDGQRIRDPYPIDDAPMVVMDSHPQCLCTNRPSTGNTGLVNEELGQRVTQGETAPVTPFTVELFLNLLIAYQVWQLARDMFAPEGVGG